MNTQSQTIIDAATQLDTTLNEKNSAIDSLNGKLQACTYQGLLDKAQITDLQGKLKLVTADDQSLGAQLLAAQAKLAAASWSTLRGITALSNLHMLPAKTTDAGELPGVWIDSGGHTGQSNPGTNKTPHGTFAYTPGTFTSPARIFFTPGAGWDNAFIYEKFGYQLPTLVRQRRIFSMLPTDMPVENCVEWQDEWISKSLACKFNLGWQWNRSSKLFRYFDQNAQTWRPSPVPYIELGTSPIELIGEFVLDPIKKTTTHIALSVAGVRTPVNVTQPATPAPGANDKYTISIIQMDSLGLGKPFGCNIHQCETLYL
jgi:hypothetical protein